MDVEHVDKKAKIEEVEEPVKKDLGEILKRCSEANVELLQVIAVMFQRMEKLESVFNQNLFTNK